MGDVGGAHLYVGTIVRVVHEAERASGVVRVARRPRMEGHGEQDDGKVGQREWKPKQILSESAKEAACRESSTTGV